MGGTLLLQDADALGTLNGLQALSKVLGNLTISGSDNLAAASLPGLTAVGGSMTISSNRQLLGVSMEALASIGVDLVISQNAALGNASIGSLADVGGSLTVATTGLQSFAGFSALNEVRGTSYSVSSNSSLPCEQVEARYCLLTTKPATYLNQNKPSERGVQRDRSRLLRSGARHSRTCSPTEGSRAPATFTQNDRRGVAPPKTSGPMNRFSSTPAANTTALSTRRWPP